MSRVEADTRYTRRRGLLRVGGLDKDVLDVRQQHHHVLPVGLHVGPIQPHPLGLVEQHLVLVSSGGNL